jgi:carboxylesterase type B
MNFVKPNLAIEDVETALKWVNRNIRNFNGNPKNITLMGSRQGAKIASFLSRRKQSRKLFSRLILISGALDDSSIFVSNRQFLRKQMQNIANTTKCIDTESDLDSMTRDQLDKVTECVAKYNKAVDFLLISK